MKIVCAEQSSKIDSQRFSFDKIPRASLNSSANETAPSPGRFSYPFFSGKLAPDTGESTNPL
jgi:hypothetical protein